MTSGWNLWVWLECVVSGCCCKEVYRYPHIIITFPYSLVLALFLAAASLLLCSFFKSFFVLVWIAYKNNSMCVQNIFWLSIVCSYFVYRIHRKLLTGMKYREL